MRWSDISDHYSSSLIFKWDSTIKLHECTLSQISTRPDMMLDVAGIFNSNNQPTTQGNRRMGTDLWQFALMTTVPHWERPWPNFPLSHIVLILELTSPSPIPVMLSARLGTDAYRFWKSWVWLNLECKLMTLCTGSMRCTNPATVSCALSMISVCLDGVFLPLYSYLRTLSNRHRSQNCDIGGTTTTH